MGAGLCPCFSMSSSSPADYTKPRSIEVHLQDGTKLNLQTWFDFDRATHKVKCDLLRDNCHPQQARKSKLPRPPSEFREVCEGTQEAGDGRGGGEEEGTAPIYGFSEFHPATCRLFEWRDDYGIPGSDDIQEREEEIKAAKSSAERGGKRRQRAPSMMEAESSSTKTTKR